MDPSPYAGSGAGGKIRRRPPPRAAATPYARPPAAAAAHRLAAAAAAASSGPSGEGGGGGGSSGWVSRLVDPASRLIAGGAARLFSSVFRKRLGPAPAQAPPLSSSSGGDTEPKQDVPASTYVNSSSVLEDGTGKKHASMSDDKALSEVEHLLMRKTFTRIEFDRLTDLLRSRTIESNLPTDMVSDEEKKEGSTRTNEPGGSTLRGMAAAYSPTVKVQSHGANSPAELAKQYMSSRYSREPQSSSLRSRLFLENKGEASNIAYDRRPGQPVVQERFEFGNENPGLPVNGYATPGLRGRSAICRMSRSPYFKGPSSSGDVSMSSLSQGPQSLHAGGRQVLKRRAADLENEHGSVGPIRRIRQKSNMMSSFRYARANPQGNLLTSHTSGSDFTEDNLSIQESPSSKKLLLGTGQSTGPLESHKDGDIKSGDTIPPIPPQSNKMAEKIFEQLNIMAPSPKEKQSGKQSIANNSSPNMSKQPVLQDNGPSSMGGPSGSLKFQDSDGANEPLDQELNGSKKGKQKLTDDGPSKVASPDKPTILENSVSAAKSRKPGFKMAVLEDFSELDDDLEEPIPSKNSPSKIEVGRTKQKFDSSNRKEQKVEQKVGPNLLKENVVDSPVSERHIAPVSTTVLSSGLLSPNDLGRSDTAGASAENNTGFTFSHVPSGTPTGSTTSALPVASVKDNKQSGVSTSIFGLKQSSTSDLGTSTAADVKNKAELSQSVTKPTTLDNTNSEKGDNRERAVDVIQSSDKVLPSAASTTLNAPLHFSSTASSSSSLSNGFSYSSSPKLTPAAKPALSSAPSTSIFAVASSSPALSSSTPPSTAFSFGSSTLVGSSMAESVKSEIAEAKPATITFGIGSTTAETKSIAPDSISKPSSNLLTSPSTFSSSPTSSASIFSSISTFSSSPVAASSVAAGSTTTTVPSGVQSGSTAAFTLSSSSGIFGFSSPAQSTGLSTTIAPSTSQPPASSPVFGSKPPQSEATVSKPPQSSVAQFGLSFPTSGVGASSSGSGTVSFGAGASSAGSGTMSFGVGTSSSAPGTVAFGAAASSGPGIFSFGAGTSSSGSGTVSFGLGAGAASSGPGTVSFGAGATSSGPGTVSIGAGATSSGPEAVSFGVGAASSGPGAVSFGAGTASTRPGTVSFGVGAASSGSGTFSFGAGAASSGSGTFSFGAGASSSGPGTVSFGATSSTAGSGFGSSQFGAGSTFSTPFSSSPSTGFAFSSPSSSAVSATVVSTSVFSSSAAASSTSSFSNPFGSSSSSPSTFTFGQSASSGGGFAFVAQSAPAFSSQPPVFSFTSASTSMNSSTAQPAFGMTNPNTGFGMSSTGNDQMNDDSMADDTNQAAPTSAPIFGSSPFGQQGNSPVPPVFGAPSAQPGGLFQFGGQQQGSVPQNPAFPPAGSLEFQGGGFSLGSGGAGGDKSNRRVIKVKRGPKKR